MVGKGSRDAARSGQARIRGEAARRVARQTGRSSAVAIGHGRTSPAAIARGATDRRATASVRGRGNRRIDPVRHANANPGRTSRWTARHPAIDRGRQSPPGRARSESRGSASHRPIGHGAASRPIVRVRPANASRGATSRQAAPREATVPGAISRRVAHPAATVPGAGSRPIGQDRREAIVRPMRAVVRPIVDRAEAGGAASRRRQAASAPGAPNLPQAAARREVIALGAPSRAIRIASRSRRAVHARVAGTLPPRKRRDDED